MFFGSVVVARNGQEGLREFTEGKFDLVITDLTMPIMDGITMLKAIYAQKSDISTIVMTAHNTSDHLIEMIELQVDGFLFKPMEIDKTLRLLYQVCKKILNRHECVPADYLSMIDALANIQMNLIEDDDYESIFIEKLKYISGIVGVGRACIFEHREEEDSCYSVKVYEYTQECISHDKDENFKEIIQTGLFPRWKRAFDNDEMIDGAVSSFPSEEREIFESLHIVSLLAIPIHIRSELWGFIVFYNENNIREWNESICVILRTFSTTLVNAIINHRQAQRLKEAKKIIDDSTTNIFIFQKEGWKLTYANRIASEKWGYSINELIAKWPQQVFDSFEAEKFAKLLSPLEKEGCSYVLVDGFIIKSSDGKLHPVEIKIEKTVTKEAEKYVAMVMDITERLVMQEELRKQKEAFEHLYQKSSDAVLIIENGQWVDMNESAIKMFNASSKEEILDLVNPFSCPFSPEYQPDGSRSYDKLIETMQECMEVGYCKYELLYKRLDESEFWVESVMTNIKIGERTIIHAIWRDISERKMFEMVLLEQQRTLVALNNELGNKTTQQHKLYRKLEYSETYQKAIFDGQPNMIIALVNNTIIRDGNRAFLDFIGFETIELFLEKHHRISEFFIEKEGYLKAEMESMNWVEYVKHYPDHSHCVAMRNRDKESVFNVNISEMFIENDLITIVSFSDITELESYKNTLEERIESEVIQNREKDRLINNQSKSAQMGEMLNMIAHQWRQPLNAISASAISVAMKLDLEELNEESIRSHTTFIQSHVQKMSNTINDFMNFFKSEQEKQWFKLVDVMKDIESLMEVQLNSRGIRLSYDSNMPIQIFGYKKELAHVLINIIANARDAYELIHSETKIIEVALYKNENENKIYIVVRDHAGGIPDEHMDKIFNPYFTTKEPGKGTGIGLYMSKRIMQEILRGSIFVSNSEDGAVFTLAISNET
jgi:PAS domain S-box-containing protein